MLERQLSTHEETQPSVDFLNFVPRVDAVVSSSDTRKSAAMLTISSASFLGLLSNNFHGSLFCPGLVTTFPALRMPSRTLYDKSFVVGSVNFRDLHALRMIRVEYLPNALLSQRTANRTNVPLAGLLGLRALLPNGGFSPHTFPGFSRTSDSRNKAFRRVYFRQIAQNTTPG